MKNTTRIISIVVSLLFSSTIAAEGRYVADMNAAWKFMPGESTDAFLPEFDDSGWRLLNLPHDWSIESDFSEQHPATPGGGALPGGVGWYRKSFRSTVNDNQRVFIDFDGVYRNSEVWINGHYLGKRPFGYIGFRYELTAFLRKDTVNILAVKVDNSRQPNSRWYSGSGIYRNVWLTVTSDVYVAHWGTYVTTPEVSAEKATATIQTRLVNSANRTKDIEVSQLLKDAKGKTVASTKQLVQVEAGKELTLDQSLRISAPRLWSVDDPALYTIETQLTVARKLVDSYSTPVGFRWFEFHPEKGFFLNGKSLKINGVCMHHDLGALGAAVNTRAIERQLEILKAMGVNGIRTAHNPPAPELLQLCDRMGFIVQDEAFDVWRKGKSAYDYSLDFPDWYERDLTDLIRRDRNHPSVFMWSIGNEVQEQWLDTNRDTLNLQEANLLLNFKKEINTDEYKDGKGSVNALITQRLAEIVKSLDPTRPVTAGSNETRDVNFLFQSEALDLIGFNYHELEYADVPTRFPGKPFIVTESVSSLHTRGYYVYPSDSMVIAPKRWDIPYFDPSQQCSSYDNSHVPWGSTHARTLKIVKESPHIAGQYIWTGFDYLGEPTPYWWPSRSSFFGLVDLAGIPKDSYYLYQSEWTDTPMLHVFPHWNWQPGQLVDVWAYFNQADEAELFLNGRSLGRKSKGDAMQTVWKVPFEPGTISVTTYRNNMVVLSKEIHTAGPAVAVKATPDRSRLKADGKDLSFITVELIDAHGNACPLADQLVRFSVEGEGFIAGTDNGNQNDHRSLKKPERNLFYGKCVGIVQNYGHKAKLKVKIEVEGLPTETVVIRVR
jgi:beta-galactosidase